MDKRMNMYPSICKILKRTYTTNGNNNNVRQQIFNALEKQKGNVFTREFIVDETKSTTFVKPIDIYSTPAMIWDMEWFTRDIILDTINDVVVATDYEENLDSVGTNVVFKQLLHFMRLLLKDKSTVSSYKMNNLFELSKFLTTSFQF